MDLIHEFEEQVQFYIMSANSLYNINSKKDILDLFPNQAQTLKTHMRKNNLRFKKHFESDLVALSLFYDRLDK
jgi:hypothetical protein